MSAPSSLRIAALLAFALGGCVVSFDGYQLDESDAGTGGSAGSGGVGGASGSAGTTGGSGGVGATGGTGGTGGTGASGGSAGAAGSSGTAGAGATGGSAGSGGSCPSKPGAAMLAVPDPGGGFYCIDKTEVTRDQYYVFLNSPPSSQIAECTGNTFTPSNSGECQGVVSPATLGDHPIVCVDWCDAYAYCAAVGKRLCGGIGGSSTPSSGLVDATKSQWFNACSANGTRTYPYGNVYEPQRCNGLQASTVSTAPTGGVMFAQCQGGFDNLYDMSGNASEWEDGCSGNNCPSRGGGYPHDFDTMTETLKCESAAPVPRMEAVKYRGFRCCWDASVP